MAYCSAGMASPATDPPQDAVPLGRRDRRRERTRGQLTGAARTLIAEKGIDGLRIADVTDVADVGRGSFYNYFESKEELVEAILSDSIQTLAAVAIGETLEDADPAVLTCIADRRFIRLASEDREFARLLVNLNRGDDLFLNYDKAEPFYKSHLDALASVESALTWRTLSDSEMDYFARGMDVWRASEQTIQAAFKQNLKEQIGRYKILDREAQVSGDEYEKIKQEQQSYERAHFKNDFLTAGRFTAFNGVAPYSASKPVARIPIPSPMSTMPKTP